MLLALPWPLDLTHWTLGALRCVPPIVAGFLATRSWRETVARRPAERLRLAGLSPLLNALGGLLFGWVFWRWGLPYAMVCHFAADLVVQSLGPIFRRMLAMSA